MKIREKEALTKRIPRTCNTCTANTFLLRFVIYKKTLHKRIKIYFMMQKRNDKSHMNFSFNFIEDSPLRLQVSDTQTADFLSPTRIYIFFCPRKENSCCLFMYRKYIHILIYYNHFPYFLLYTRSRYKQHTWNMLPEYQFFWYKHLFLRKMVEFWFHDCNIVLIFMEFFFNHNHKILNL